MAKDNRDRQRYERLRKISERLKREYHAEKVILFGSHARGEATEEFAQRVKVCDPLIETIMEEGIVP
jgi:predicted nucleotidyltransferase